MINTMGKAEFTLKQFGSFYPQSEQLINFLSISVALQIEIFSTFVPTRPLTKPLTNVYISPQRPQAEAEG